MRPHYVRIVIELDALESEELMKDLRAPLGAVLCVHGYVRARACTHIDVRYSTVRTDEAEHTRVSIEALRAREHAP